MPRCTHPAYPPDGRHIRADAGGGGGQLLTDVDGTSRRIADVTVDAARSNVQTRLQLHGGRQLPPRGEHAASGKTSVPDPQMSRFQEKTRASCTPWLPRHRRCEYPHHDVPAQSEKPLLEPKDTSTSSSSTQAEAATHDVPPMPSHSSPPVLAWFFPGWPIQFLIRTDRGGSFHTYPRLSGPFQSLQEAENAFDNHLDDLRSPIMCTDGLPQAEKAVWHALYWPDGTRRMSSKSHPTRRNINLLVQALLDKYSEDHRLLGDLAYELDGLVTFQEFYMGETSCLKMYCHLNFTTKTKGADGSHGGSNNLFFAEVARIKGENVEYVLNCFCMVQHNDNGQCYGCTTYGNVDLKHPVNADQYEGRHSRPHKTWCGAVHPGVPAYIKNEEDRLADEEARIRRVNMCRDEPPSLAKPDGAEMPAGLAKSEDACLAKKEGVCLAKREDAGLAKRDDGQGSGKYIVPARRHLV
ncbi:uncharacterized protein [Triticum aestivum]|uniref:uncharacterized protein n=1 Tax=Triticum aestivum TaxID=4565 RepID=UPI0008458952|nr:uncharacterized protein LOC123093295 [Triticum aestivum]